MRRWTLGNLPLLLSPPYRCKMLLGLFGWAPAVVLCGLLAPSALQAQYPRAPRGQFEVPGLDFGRDGGWRVRVGAVRAARSRGLRNGAIAALNLAAPAGADGRKVTGRVIVPVLRCIR